MTQNQPRVTIGMPVYNGENYLEEAIDSILAQTYTDFELVISDNASTDRTEEICCAYVARDNRVRYVRNKTNLGASKNYNALVNLARGEYFKWSAHDDLCAPEFLEKCVEVLDRDESIVLTYPRTRVIDQDGNVINEPSAKPDLASPRPHKRFFECVCKFHPQVAVFGLIRLDVLKKTRLIDSFSSSDRTLLGELVLRGRFHEIPEFLFFKREHPQAHWKVYPTRQARQAWYDPAKKGTLSFPHWRLLWEHFVSIMRVPLKWSDRALCSLYMGWWMRKNWKYLGRNLILKDW